VSTVKQPGVAIVAVLKAEDGAEVARSAITVDVPASPSTTVVALPPMRIPKALLWTLERPTLYTVRTTLTFGAGQP